MGTYEDDPLLVDLRGLEFGARFLFSDSYPPFEGP